MVLYPIYYRLMSLDYLQGSNKNTKKKEEGKWKISIKTIVHKHEMELFMRFCFSYDKFEVNSFVNNVHVYFKFYTISFVQIDIQNAYQSFCQEKKFEVQLQKKKKKEKKLWSEAASKIQLTDRINAWMNEVVIVRWLIAFSLNVSCVSIKVSNNSS